MPERCGPPKAALISYPTGHITAIHESVEDRSHTAHRLQTTLTPGQEAILVYLRKTLLL